jgi:hypothetical protein
MRDAQVWNPTAEIWRRRAVRGVAESFVMPSPSWPTMLLPQH